MKQIKSSRSALALVLAAMATVAAQPAMAQSGSVQNISARDKAAGAQAHPQLLAEFGGAMQGPQADYVRRIGQKIAVQSGLSNAQNDFTITLLNSSVDNAFAIPGGYVYITRQLLGLMNDEAELASVMGHEVGHVAARHSQKRQSRAQLGGLGTILATVLGGAVGGNTGARLGQSIGGNIAQRAVLGYSRAQEYEADDLGVAYLGRAGFDPQASATMLRSLAAESALEARLAGRAETPRAQWSSTHPDPASRVARAVQRARSINATGTARNRDAFLAAIDGMPYDDDPRQGVIDGQTFRHPDLRLMFTAPTGYALSNSPQAVTISGAGGQASFAGGAYNGDLAAYVGSVFRAIGGNNAQIDFGRVETTEINGLRAGYASARANAQSGAVTVTVYAYEFAPNAAYHFVAISPASAASPFDSLFRSLRRLTSSEASAIRGRKIRVVTIRPNDTVQSLAAQMAYRDQPLARFLTLNAIPEGARLVPGKKVKLVVYD